MFRQIAEAAKMKAASWMALQKQREKVCEAAKEYVTTRNEENYATLHKATRRLQSMESIQ